MDALPPEADAPGLYDNAPDSGAFNRLRKGLIRQTRHALEAYGMIGPDRGRGQRWLVCLSGGKDSYTLLTLLLDLRWRGLLEADLLACNLDQGQPGFPKDVLPAYLGRLQVPHRIDYRDTYSVVIDKTPAGKTTCALCSRLRRGNLYRIAREEGCAAVVLGHHREDALETFLLNLMYGGRIAAMPPRLLNDEGDLIVLRPLILCAEAEIARFAAAMRYPIIPCDLCGSQEGLQRGRMKEMIASWERERPGATAVMARAMGNIRPGQMLDPALFDFGGLRRDAGQAGKGDNSGLDAPSAAS